MSVAMFKVIAPFLWRDRAALAMAFFLPPLVFLIFSAVFSGATGDDVRLKVAVAALTRADITGPTGELTGPQSLTQREQVAAIAAATGRPVRLEELTPEQAHEHLRRVMPPQIADPSSRARRRSTSRSGSRMH